MSAFAEYVTRAAAQAGSDAALGKICGFADGSRIGAAKRGDLIRPRLSEIACIKMARYTNDDPLLILRLAGHEEMADLLAGQVQPPQVEDVRRSLMQVRGIIDLALNTTGGSDNGKQTEGNQEPSRGMGSQMARKRRKGQN